MNNPSWSMLLAGVLFMLAYQTECQTESTVVVRDSAELASALRNASDASQTAPTTTVIYLNLLSSEVGTHPRLKGRAFSVPIEGLISHPGLRCCAGCTECGLLCHQPAGLHGQHHHQYMAGAEGHHRFW